MEKRLFNKLGFETSLLGLGCMRFPQKNGKIDLLETEKLVDACMAGVALHLKSEKIAFEIRKNQSV